MRTERTRGRGKVRKVEEEEERRNGREGRETVERKGRKVCVCIGREGKARKRH